MLQECCKRSTRPYGALLCLEGSLKHEAAEFWLNPECTVQSHDGLDEKVDL